VRRRVLGGGRPSKAAGGSEGIRKASAGGRGRVEEEGRGREEEVGGH
jgi:hypothetical protein